MELRERSDLYRLLTGLSNKLDKIAGSTIDIETADELYELVLEIDDSADKIIYNRW